MYKIVPDKKEDFRVVGPLGSMSLGEFLQLARKSYSGTYAELLLDADIDHATFYSIVKGKNRSVRAVLRIAFALGYDIKLEKQS